MPNAVVIREIARLQRWNVNALLSLPERLNQHLPYDLSVSRTTSQIYQNSVCDMGVGHDPTTFRGVGHDA